MKEQIDAILSPFKREGYDAGAEFNGKFWEVWIGSHGGGRENGVSLAKELAEKVRGRSKLTPPVTSPEPRPAPQPPEPKPEPEPAQPDPRIDLQAARIAELEAALAAAKAQKSDMFDASDLADLIREDEPHADAQRRWRLQYTQLNNRLVDPRLPPLTDAERALLNRLQRALYAGRHGAVETI